MNRTLGILGTALLFVAPVGSAVAQQATATSARLDGLCGVVADRPITCYDVFDRWNTYLQLMKSHGLPTQFTPEAARAELDTITNLLIDDQVLLSKAKELKIDPPSDYLLAPKVDAQIKSVRANYSSEAEFQLDLARSGMGTPDDYRKYLMDQHKIDTTITLVYQKYQSDKKITPVNVSEAEVEAEFDREKAAGLLPARPATIVFRQLVIAPVAGVANRAVARAKAESLLAEIRGGASFEGVAKRESMDPSTKDQGGDLGSISRGKLVPEIDRLLFGPFAMRPGDVSPVTETAFGFHIIRMDRATPTEVHARHILIRPTIDSVDLERGHRLADSVAGLARAGAPIDTLARKYNDYAGQEESGLMQPWPVDSLPPAYKTGLADKKPGDIAVFPIPTAIGVPKFVVAQIVSYEDGGEYTLGDVRENIRSRLSYSASIRRFLDALRKQTYWTIDMSRVYAILSDSPAVKPPEDPRF